MPIPYISLPQISLPKTPSWKDVLGYLGSYGTPSTSTMSSNLRRQYNEDASTNALIRNINEAHRAGEEIQAANDVAKTQQKREEALYNATEGYVKAQTDRVKKEREEEQIIANSNHQKAIEDANVIIAAIAADEARRAASASKEKAEWDRLLNEAIAKKNQEILGNPTPEQQAEKLESSKASQNARLESNSSKSEPTKEDKKEQSENTAKREEAAQESVARGNNEQQQSEEAAKKLTLGNFFDYTNPYFQYYTAPTALGLGLGGLLGGWKGSLLGTAGGAGLGALAKYLVDNDKIHMA